ncbi:MAG: hypothetical protein HYW81_00040 [Parcubacteria group bacterium]|nr:hypothetical protein [Parcubacteria group bacterium]
MQGKEWYNEGMLAASTTYPDIHGIITGVVANVTSFNFQSPTWDMFIILFFLVASFVYGLTLGRDRIIMILITVYITLAVVGVAPFMDELIPPDANPNNVFMYKIVLFLGVFVALFFLLSRSAILRALARSDAPGEWWQIVVFSILHVGLLISITLSFIPEEYYGQLSQMTRDWFVGEGAVFFWVIAPVAAMTLVGGGKD